MERIYRARRIIKLLFPAFVVIVASCLLAGVPSLIVLLATNSVATIQPTNVKMVMSSGITLFLLLIGFLGWYFISRTDYKHATILIIIGMMMVGIAELGLMALWNFAWT